MPATKIQSHGRHRVFRETLTDRSHVYNVVSQSDDGPEIVFACIDERHAEQLASILQVSVVDIAVRDVGGK